MNELQELLMNIIKNNQKLAQIRHQRGQYMMTETEDWILHEFEENGRLMDEAFNLASPEYPDAQQILNHEHDEQIELEAAS